MDAKHANTCMSCFILVMFVSEEIKIEHESLHSNTVWCPDAAIVEIFHMAEHEEPPG